MTSNAHVSSREYISSRVHFIINNFILNFVVNTFTLLCQKYTYTFRNLIFLNDDPLSHYFLYFARELLCASYP